VPLIQAETMLDLISDRVAAAAVHSLILGASEVVADRLGGGLGVVYKPNVSQHTQQR
jgi:hypothetical protein